jgi:hypothetical protein
MSQQTELDDMTEYSEERIRAELPATTTERQTRTLVAAIRNPDVSISEIAEAHDIDHPSNITSTLKSLASGSLYMTQDDLVDASRNATKERGESRPAESFDELTDRQKAVVDFLARHPCVDWYEASSREIYEAIQEYDEGYARDTPDMSVSYPREVAKKYSHLIASRRNDLPSSEVEDVDEDVDVGDFDTYEFTSDDTPRDVLERAGFDLPDENLDVDEASDEDVSEQLSDEERLERAFRRSDREYYAQVEVGVNDEDETGKLPVEVVVDGERVNHETRAENHIRDDTLDDEDVDVGEAYVGVVNGKSEWGVWFTIGGDPSSVDDVSGVASKELLAKVGKTLDDYEEGDREVLAVAGRSTGDDGRVRHRFIPVPTDDALDGRETGENDEDEVDVDEGVDDEGRGEASETRLSRAVSLPVEGEDELNDALDTLVGENDRLRERVNELERDAHDEADDLRARIREVEERLEAVENVNAGARLEGLADHVDDLADEVRGLDDRVDTEIDDLVDYVESLRERIDDMAAFDAYERGVELGEAIRTIRENGGSVTFEADTSGNASSSETQEDT